MICDAAPIDSTEFNIKGDYVGTLTEIRRLKDAEERLEFLAHNDTLTGLPNRMLLLAHLRQALELATRSTQQLNL